MKLYPGMSLKKKTGIMLLTVFVLASVCFLSSSVELSSDFSTEVINRKVCEYKWETIDQTTPLNLFLTNMYAQSEGKSKLFAAISTVKFQLDTNVAEQYVTTRKKLELSNTQILKNVIYRNSVAAIVTRNVDGWILLNYTWLENGKWVNGGQGIAQSEMEVDSILQINLPVHFRNISRINCISTLPSDVSSFVEFLKNQTESPEAFLLQQLVSHKLVINGEIHRRRVSWEMLRRLIRNHEFYKVCGTIFMELPSWHQTKMDEFLFSKRFCPNLILDIFRDEQINGWWDRGEYEFICDLWRCNQSLPTDERISVILTDYQMPFSTIESTEDVRAAIENAEERDTHMADIIENHILYKSDHRNCLFLVGLSHANNSHLNALFSSSKSKYPVFNASTQLKQRLGDSAVFSVFQHTMSSDNAGKHKSLLRGGIFDNAFALDGNRPLGFCLMDSPFGTEPFDGIYEYKYNADCGSYQDNFDGYLFLHSLDDEPQNEPLFEIFDDEFICEMKRRAEYFGWENRKDIWFGFISSEITKQKIIENLPL